MPKWLLAGLPCLLGLMAPNISDGGVGAAPPAGSSAVDDTDDLKTLRGQQAILRQDVKKYSTNQVELAALNRARTGLAIALNQEAILVLRADMAGAYDQASQLVREAESLNLAIDTSTLGADDLRVHADLQGLSRRALSAQVDYLRHLIESKAVPASTSTSGPTPSIAPSPTITMTLTPVVGFMVTTYQPAPTLVYVRSPAPSRVVQRPGLFRCATPR